jgi:hypothetical protein
MALVQYTTYLFYPSGGPVADRAVPVTVAGSNFTPPLYADRTGTTPKEGVVITAAVGGDRTDADGKLSFFAAPGHYTTEIAGEIFTIPLDPAELAPAIPGLYVHEQATPATVWNVMHGFGTEPDVTVVSSGLVVAATVAHPDKQNTTITFGAPTSGTANLRR